MRHLAILIGAAAGMCAGVNYRTGSANTWSSATNSLHNYMTNRYPSTWDAAVLYNLLRKESRVPVF